MNLARFAPFPKTQRLLRLLGADESRGRTPVLLALQPKQKAPTAPGWNAFSWDQHMSDPGYLAALEAAGNVGVLLGEASGGLAAVDIDDDDLVEPFLRENPALAGALRTRGSRGCQIWLWPAADQRFQKLGVPDWPQGWPARHYKLARRQGEGAPLEWRGGNCQSVVAGIHPNGNAYQVLVDAPPMEYRWRDIRWPAGLTRPWVREILAAVEAKAGTVFERPEGGDFSLCEHAAAVWFAAISEVLFEPEEGSFYRYEPENGLWEMMTDEGMCAAISKAMLNLAKDVPADVAGFLSGNGARSQRVTRNIANFVRAEAEIRGVFADGARRRVVHARNGMVHLREEGPILRPFGPEYFSRNQIPHDFVPGAKCPRFLRDLLGRGFGPDDVELVQRLAGLLLIGQNLAQKLVLIRGPGGAGKSRIVAVFQALVGEANYAALRPERLNDRFEIGHLLGKTALFASELGPRVLASEAAAQLKGLTGGDMLPAELKGKGRPSVKGTFNCWGVTNFKGVVKCDGDIEAWERRLVVLDFDAPPPAVRIPDFEKTLMAEEGAGILAWAVEGAGRYLVELANGELLRMHPAARQRVANLLDESRSVEIFIKEVVAPYAGGSGVTLDELNEAYVEWCGDRGWEPEPHERFSGKSKDLLRSVHRLSVSNSLEREGKPRRGIRNCTLLRWQETGPELGPD